MHLIMFDIDGTLTESHAFDGECYKQAVDSVLSIDSGNDWSDYTHVTDTGILMEILERHQISAGIDEVLADVKKAFFTLCQNHLDAYGLPEIDGAGQFIQSLQKLDNVQLAIATGGWHLSAEMKLRAAGIDYSEIPFASSDDDITRIGIMQKALEKTQQSGFLSHTYFGDGIWDKKACAELAYNFIAIGNKVEHSVRYDNFSEIDFDQFIIPFK